MVALTFGAFAPVRAADPFVVDDPVGAAQLLVLANAERAAAGLPPLEARLDVTELAAEHSRRMAEAGDISHNDAYFTSAVRQRLGARSLGENVAMNKSADDAHRRLMLSPGHRANLMNPKFTVVGMAVVRGADGMGFITQDFVEPAGARPLVSAPVPAPVPAPEPPAPQPEPQPAPAPESQPDPSAAPPADPTPSRATGAAAGSGTPATATADQTTAAPGSGSTAAPPTAVEHTAAATPESGAAAAATTTTSRDVVSVVTAPISRTAAPAPATSTRRLLLGLAALALLVVAAATARRAHLR